MSLTAFFHISRCYCRSTRRARQPEAGNLKAVWFQEPLTSSSSCGCCCCHTLLWAAGFCTCGIVWSWQVSPKFVKALETLEVSLGIWLFFGSLWHVFNWPTRCVSVPCRGSYVATDAAYSVRPGLVPLCGDLLALRLHQGPHQMKPQPPCSIEALTHSAPS